MSMTETEIQKAVVGVCGLRGVPFNSEAYSKRQSRAYWQTQRLMRDIEMDNLLEELEGDIYE